MKVKLNSDDNLSLSKILTIIVRSVFQEDNICYPQFFLDEFLYEI